MCHSHLATVAAHVLALVKDELIPKDQNGILFNVSLPRANFILMFFVVCKPCIPCSFLKEMSDTS